MSGLELNKIAAAVLATGLIMMVIGKIADGLYHVPAPENRGYQIEVADTGGDTGAAPVKAEPVDLGALLAAASVESGAIIAKKCVACHTFEQGGANKVGPNLHGTIGGKVGHASDFAYSQALLAKGGSWDYASLYQFLRSPKAYMPGTKMAFAGLKKPQELADIIAYLRSQSGSQPPLPSPGTLVE